MRNGFMPLYDFFGTRSDKREPLSISTEWNV